MKTLLTAFLFLQSPHHAVEIISFTAKPSTIHAGETAMLEWKTRGVETVSIDVEPQAPKLEKTKRTGLPRSGTLQVQPSATTRYTLNCEADGNYCPALSVTVQVR